MLHYKTFVPSQFQYHATLVHKMRGVRLMHKDYQVACKYIKLRFQIMHICKIYSIISKSIAEFYFLFLFGSFEPC